MVGSLNDYILDFEEQEDSTGYNDQALITLFVTGLSPQSIRQIHSMTPMPANLAEWKQLS
jgi:hypothetical protein